MDRVLHVLVAGCAAGVGVLIVAAGLWLWGTYRSWRNTYPGR